MLKKAIHYELNGNYYDTVSEPVRGYVPAVWIRITVPFLVLSCHHLIE